MGGWIFAEVPPNSIFVVMGMVTKSEQLYASVTYVYCQYKKILSRGPVHLERTS